MAPREGDAQLQDLERYVKEEKSNADFLSLLERRFGNLQTYPLLTIVKSIASIIDNLRIIWITSNYYNTDGTAYWKNFSPVERSCATGDQDRDAIATRSDDATNRNCL